MTLTLLTAASAGALVDVPRSLWDLSEDADVIALATVERLHPGVTALGSYAAAARFAERLEPGGDDLANDHARLRIDLVVAGTAPPELDVRFAPFSSDPDPPALEPGAQVLVFLTRRGAGWRVEGAAYGALHPSSADLPHFLERTRAARALLLRGGVTAEEELEWALATAESRATRWHGLWRLHAKRRERAPLTRAQVARLARAFIAEPSVDDTLPEMLTLLQPVRDPKLDAAVVRALDEALATGQPSRYQLREALELGLRRFTSEAQAKALVPSFKWDPDRPSRAELQAAWNKAKAQLAIPAP